MTSELETKIKQLEEEITKWKYNFNAKNADYILLYHELERYKKKPSGLWLLTLLFASLALYFYLKND